MDKDTNPALDNIDYSNEEYQAPTNVFAPPALLDSQLKQLELLQHLSMYSELLIFLSGERGMGKTFIAQALLATREAPDQSLMVEADITLGYVDLLQKLAEFFDLAEYSNEIEDLESQIIAHCIELSNDEQGSMLLILDQADQLSDDTLEDLNNLALLAPNVLHIMMLAPPEFEARLVTLSEPQAPAHVMQIEALFSDESEVLLLQSFPAKEWSVEDVDYILKQSAGNPGKILYIAQQLLSGKKTSAVSKFPITHVAAMVLVASALVMTYVYQTQGDSEDEIAQAEVKISLPEPVLEIQPQPVEDLLDKNPDNVDKIDLPVELPVDEVTTVADEEIDFNFVDSAETTQVEAPVVSNADVTEIDVKAAISDQVIDVKPKVVVAETTFTNDEKSLLASANTDFVMQLFGAYSEKNTQNFIQKYSSNDMPLSMYKTIYKGKTWHVVIAGPFENRRLAVQKSKQLPKKLQQQKPWIRSIVPVKEQIKSFK